jgi:hypothetical protein
MENGDSTFEEFDAGLLFIPNSQSWNAKDPSGAVFAAYTPSTASGDAVINVGTVARSLIEEVAGTIIGTVTVTIGSNPGTTAGTAIASGASQTIAITVTGATTSDTAKCSTNAVYPATWQTGIVVMPPIVTANTVTLQITNPTAASITPVAQTFRCAVTR